MALASAVHNNRRNTTTGLSPNQILLGYEPKLTPEISPPSNNDLAEQHIEKLMGKLEVFSFKPYLISDGVLFFY